MTMRIALDGCVESSRVVLQTLLALPPSLARVVALITRRASAYNSDYVDLAPLAGAQGIPMLCVEDAADDAAQAAWLAERSPDLLFCVGWSRLLGERTLSVAPRGTVGFHPAALPANRGRHPLVWALALGLDCTASSFFLMDAGADSGPLLSQRTIDIAPEDDAGALYAKVLAIIPGQVEEVVRGLTDGSLTPQPQDPARASYWRKRTADDGRIDWRMDADAVRNLVRALARPYPGAHFVHAGQSIKLWRCDVVQSGSPNVEPGKVLAVDGRCITVKCGRAAVRLLEHELDDLPAPGAYL